MLIQKKTVYAEGNGVPVTVMIRNMENTLTQLIKAGITVFATNVYEGQNSGFVYVKPEDKQTTKTIITLVENGMYLENRIRELYKKIHTR